MTYAGKSLENVRAILTFFVVVVFFFCLFFFCVVVVVFFLGKTYDTTMQFDCPKNVVSVSRQLSIDISSKYSFSFGNEIKVA